ncbi:hypothetical protein Tco_0578196 [Tanacetum coccineum]
MVLKYKQRTDSDGWIWRIGKHKRSKDGGFARFKRPIANNRWKPVIEKSSQEKGNKGSFTSVVAGEGSFHNKASMGVLLKQTNTIGMKHLVLNENDLLKFDDSDEVVLAKVREVELMSKLYEVMENEGFDEVEIHHVEDFGFGLNLKLKRRERMTWIKIDGLPLCAWGSEVYKKIGGLWGKFMFFDDDTKDNPSCGKVCIQTTEEQLISKTIQVEVAEVEYLVRVRETSSWAIKIDKPEIVSDSNYSLDGTEEEESNDDLKVIDQ